MIIVLLSLIILILAVTIFLFVGEIKRENKGNYSNDFEVPKGKTQFFESYTQEQKFKDAKDIGDMLEK